MSLLKRNWRLNWICIIGESFCGCYFWVRKMIKELWDENLGIV